MSWTALEVDKGHVHVYPNDDYCLHTLDSGKCQCKPVVSPVPGTKALKIVHNSWDERERQEKFDSVLRKFAEELPRRYN